jgi:hypothetical protein
MTLELKGMTKKVAAKARIRVFFENLIILFLLYKQRLPDDKKATTHSVTARRNRLKLNNDPIQFALMVLYRFYAENFNRFVGSNRESRIPREKEGLAPKKSNRHYHISVEIRETLNIDS